MNLDRANAILYLHDDVFILRDPHCRCISMLNRFYTMLSVQQDEERSSTAHDCNEPMLMLKESH